MEIGEINATDRLLASGKTEDRVRAVRMLARSGDEDAQRLLLNALKDRSNYVATLAAEALADCAGVRILPMLVAQFEYLAEDGLKNDPGCHIRANLAFAFGRLEVQMSIAALRIGIKTVQMEAVGGVPTDTAVHLRANCAQSLAQMRAPQALRDIALLLFDEGDTHFTAASNAIFVTVEARKAAAQALGRLADDAGIIPLAIKLTYPANETPEVLQECMQAIVDLEDENALELLTPYLKHEDPHFVAFTALMIARTRDPQAPALIRKTLDRLTGDPLQAAILALSSLRSEEAQNTLKELEQSPRKDIQKIMRELNS